MPLLTPGESEVMHVLWKQESLKPYGHKIRLDWRGRPLGPRGVVEPLCRGVSR